MSRFDQGTGAAMAMQRLDFLRIVQESKRALPPGRAAFDEGWEAACDEILRRLVEYERSLRGAMTRPGDPKVPS